MVKHINKLRELARDCLPFISHKTILRLARLHNYVIFHCRFGMRSTRLEICAAPRKTAGKKTRVEHLIRAVHVWKELACLLPSSQLKKIPCGEKLSFVCPGHEGSLLLHTSVPCVVPSWRSRGVEDIMHPWGKDVVLSFCIGPGKKSGFGAFTIWFFPPVLSVKEPLKVPPRGRPALNVNASIIVAPSGD